MVGPIRFDGPVSGIDYTSIIEKMLEVQRRPQLILKAQIDAATRKKNAFLAVNVSLLGLQSAVNALSRPSSFQANKTASSNESILAATGSSSATPGAASFSVRRLAQAHQMISNGFADANASAVTPAASTVSIEVGGGHIDRATPVSFLNGQNGIDRGSIRIIDSAGKVGIVDLSGAVTVQDILDEINGAASISVKATVAGNRLSIQDLAGGAGNLVISDFGTDATATSLGVARTSATLPSGAKFVLGSEINTVGLSTPLSLLNGGLGVRRNSDGATDFNIRTLNGTDIDIDIASTDLTVGDVINRINTAAAGELSASLAGNSLVLTDASGLNGAILVIPPDSGLIPPAGQEPFNSFAVVDLGLAVVTAGGAFQSNLAENSDGAQSGNQRFLVGNSLIPTLNSAMRSLLNGGTQSLSGAEPRGVSDGTLQLQDRLGASVQVDVSRQALHTQNGSVGAGQTSLLLNGVTGIGAGSRVRISTSSGIEFRTVTEVSGNTIRFDGALAGSVQDNAAVHALNDGLEDIVRLINDRAAAAGVQVRVEHNPEGNGLRIVDTSGGSGTLSVTNVSGTAAEDLGILQTVAASAINGTDLDAQWLANATLLSTLNGGQGVAAGKIRIADAHGIQFDVDLSQAGDTTLARVIQDINGAATAAASGVQARINDTGDGLLITDTAGGAPTTTLIITELNGGRTARDLNIAGAAPGATPNQINGSFEVTIDIAINATLQDVANAINAKGVGVTASILNDGSGATPYRLLLTGNRAGEAARFTADSAIGGLTFSTSIRGQDAVLLSGGGGTGGEPTVVTSAGNTVTGILPGLTLTLKGTSASPVTVTVTRDDAAITAMAQSFVDAYNEVVKKIRENASFNADTFAKGPLFSEPAILRTKRDLSKLALAPVLGIPTSDLNVLDEVGIRAGAEGTLTFDSGKFSGALASSFDQVRDLFILQRKLTVSTLVKDLNSGSGISDVSGNDLRITARDGTVFDVDLAGATTLGSILTRINTAAGNGGRVTASISPGGFSLQLVDSSFPSTTPFSVANVSGATAASQLKIAKTLALGGNTIQGDIIGLKGDPGAAQRLSEALDLITADGDGLIATRIDAIDTSVNRMNESISRIEKRALQVQENLIRKFTALEKVIAQSQSTQQRLSQLLAGLASQGNGSF